MVAICFGPFAALRVQLGVVKTSVVELDARLDSMATLTIHLVAENSLMPRQEKITEECMLRPLCYYYALYLCRLFLSCQRISADALRCIRSTRVQRTKEDLLRLRRRV